MDKNNAPYLNELFAFSTIYAFGVMYIFYARVNLNKKSTPTEFIRFLVTYSLNVYFLNKSDLEVLFFDILH